MASTSATSTAAPAASFKPFFQRISQGEDRHADVLACCAMLCNKSLADIFKQAETLGLPKAGPYYGYSADGDFIARLLAAHGLVATIWKECPNGYADVGVEVALLLTSYDSIWECGHAVLYHRNTSADGKVLRITGKNDGAKIFVNKSTDPSDLKPLRITEKGLPDLTGVTGVPMSGEGMTANLYEGLGWKYATMEENGRTRAALYITTPDGNPVDLSSDTINPYHKAIAVEQITFANVTVTGIVAEGSVGAENTIIQDGTFQKDVYMDENSTIAGGTFQDVVRAYGKITGGSFIAEVQLNQNSEVTGGVFHDVQLPNYASEKTVIQNAVILGSLTGNNSEVAVSNTVSCGYIESKYLAAGQQQSKLMMTDGTVERLNDYAAATDAVYLIGNVKAEIRFSNAVTNINGEDVSAYNGAQLSADGKTLTLTAKNDGEPIVVNMATTGKLPFSSLSKSDFTVSGSASSTATYWTVQDPSGTKLGQLVQETEEAVAEAVESEAEAVTETKKGLCSWLLG